MQRLKEALSSDIPFARDDAHQLLPLMIACLAGFAALLLAIGMTLSGALGAQSKDVTGVIEVELPYARSHDKAVMDQVLATLRTTEGVEDVVVLQHEDMEALLKPWLGDNFSLGDLPVPLLIDVKTEVKGDATVVDLINLDAKLHKIDPNIHMEDRGPWVNHMVKAATLLQALVLMVALLLLACVLGMIVLVARTNLKLHFKTVSLLHLFGATDEYILRQFQRNSAMLAARGAVLGVVVAAGIFLAAVLISHHWASPILPVVSFGMPHLVVFVALPVFVALTALLATRLTIQSMLSQMR